jgi:hypothetical protein
MYEGSLVMNWQVFDAVGIASGFTANLLLSTQGKPPLNVTFGEKRLTDVGRLAWRWQIASSCLPSVALLSAVLCARLDSPRFLMKCEASAQARYDAKKFRSERPHTQGHYLLQWYQDVIQWSRGIAGPDVRKPYRSATWEVLLSLRGHPVLAAKELIFTHCQLLVEVHSRKEKAHQTRDDPDTNFSLSREKRWWRRARRLLSKPEILREVLAAVIVMLSQQLCGINLLIIYSSSLFCWTDSAASRAPFWFSWGIGLTNVIFAVPTYFLIDKRGRKWLLMVTIPFLACFLAVAARSFKIPDAHMGSKKALITVFTYLFTAAYSLGVGPVPFTYSAEIFPLEQRIVGMSLAVCVNLLGFGLLILFAPFAPHATLLEIFAGLNAVAFVLIWLFVPEVAGTAIYKSSTGLTHLNLDQLSQIFRLKTWTHVQYQISVSPAGLWRQCVGLWRKIWGIGPDSSLRGASLQTPTFFTWGQKHEASKKKA